MSDTTPVPFPAVKAPLRRSTVAFGFSFLVALCTATHAGPAPLPGGTPVDLPPGPWNATPIAPGQRNYQIVLDYSAPPGTTASVSLQGWKRLLPAGENQRAEFAIEDANGSPFIIRHWREERARPESTDRPREGDGDLPPVVTLTAPEEFRVHSAAIRPLRESDHGELWAKVSSAEAATGAALYQTHCQACHGDKESHGQYPGLLPWKEREVSLPRDPYSLWRAFNDTDGTAAAGHPRLTEEEAYHVVRYLREHLLPSAPESEPAGLMPRGRVLAEVPVNRAASDAPWRRMDHGPFLFQPLILADEYGKTTLEIEQALIVRLDPGLGGVTRGKSWAIYDIGEFRLLGIARGGRFSDSSAIFDGNGPPGLTLRGSSFEWKEAPADEAPAVFKAVAVSGREVFIYSTQNGVEFCEHFLPQSGRDSALEKGLAEEFSPPMLPDPAGVESVTVVRADAHAPDAPIVAEAILAPAPEALITGSWMRFTGLAARDKTSVFLCTPNGEVWLVTGLDTTGPRWRRFASGLDGPHRLALVDGTLEARCRNGWFRLLDANNDGFCERYERKTIPPDDVVAARVEQLARYAAPARSGDNTWYFATPATEATPGAGLIRGEGGPPAEGAESVYAWLPGAESVPPAPPVWLPEASKWSWRLHGGLLLPCRDSGRIFRLWAPRPGDLSQPRVLWSLPVPPVETDIMAADFTGSSIYLCGLPLDAGFPGEQAGFWRVRRRFGDLFHPVEFAADDQSVTLRFNLPVDAAATAASRFVRVRAWQPGAAISEEKVSSPRRVLLGKDTMRVVSDMIAPGQGVTIECDVTDERGASHRFVVHFTLPAELPVAVLPAPRPRELPPPIVAGEEGPPAPKEKPATTPLLDDVPAFEWPERLPELDDPIENEQPLPEP